MGAGNLLWRGTKGLVKAPFTAGAAVARTAKNAVLGRGNNNTPGSNTSQPGTNAAAKRALEQSGFHGDSPGDVPLNHDGNPLNILRSKRGLALAGVGLGSYFGAKKLGLIGNKSEAKNGISPTLAPSGEQALPSAVRTTPDPTRSFGPQLPSQNVAGNPKVLEFNKKDSSFHRRALQADGRNKGFAPDPAKTGKVADASAITHTVMQDQKVAGF